jgi:hypothetical protein
MIDYGKRLDWAMDRAGIDAKGLASALGVSTQAIIRVRSGDSKSLSAENNAFAAKELGVCPSWLATGMGPRLPETPFAHDVKALDDNSGANLVAGRGGYGFWPFKSVTRAQWAKLDQDDRTKLELQVMAVVRYKKSC